MNSIRHQRLRNQYLTAQKLKDPVDVLKSLVAIQGQDYAGAKWALAQRTINCTNDQVEKALTDGRILRLHLMRQTWHFVHAEDVRWILQLSAPRLNAVRSSYFRQAGLDDKIFRRTNNVIMKALSGGRQLTRAELRDAVARVGIEPGDSTRFGHILLRAELDGLICSGARKGNQFTYALLAERAPRSRILERDEALGELALRYFTTRGPATVQDLVWWSGLTVSDVRRAIDIAGDQLNSNAVDGKVYWLAGDKRPGSSRAVSRVHLLPNYDEYFIAYKDRSAAIHPKVDQTGMSYVFDAPMVMDGQVVGGWQRNFAKNVVKIQLEPFIKLTRSDRKDFNLAAERYAKFLGKELDSEQ